SAQNLCLSAYYILFRSVKKYSKDNDFLSMLHGCGRINFLLTLDVVSKIDDENLKNKKSF
ncbi:MAG: hypothetical protein IJC16_08155, partial [Rikenellaceae bacterium]|nr:hypothetical protein [Rikenellaceae bacterium]